MNLKALTPVLLTLGLVVAGCGEAEESSNTAASEHGGDHRQHSGEHEHEDAAEVAGPEARLAFTHDGGITVVRAGDGEVLTEIDLPGFLRLNHAGDGRHLMVSGDNGFRVVDLGAWTQAHGDHGHSFVVEPQLTDTTFGAATPGHVVVHDDWTVLFDDGTGTITSFDPHHLVDGELAVETTEAEQAHHGVAVRRADGSLAHTLGTEDARNGVVLLDEAGDEVARSEKCPGVHGEAFAGDVAGFGCEDGVLLLDGDRFTKVVSPDPYGRIGNLFGSPESPVLLGDYKSDPDAELERPTRISLVNTRTGDLDLLDLGTSYSFRSLARGPNGEALVLGTDGALRIIAAGAGEVVATVPVVSAWEEPAEWQQPRPTISVVGNTAWISEPATKQLHAVDLVDGSVDTTLDLDQAPNELLGVTG